MIVVPIRTGNGLNDRGHWAKRARLVKAERDAVAWLLKGVQRPSLPCSVLLTRVAPSRGMDSDGLQGALKGCRDQIAEWLGVDDRDAETVLYRYAQRRGAQKEWAVEIEFQPRRGNEPA